VRIADDRDDLLVLDVEQRARGALGQPPGIGLLMKWMTCERTSGEIFSGGWPSVAGGCFVCRWISPNALATRCARRWPL
jgi:hypothetical protein